MGWDVLFEFFFCQIPLFGSLMAGTEVRLAVPPLKKRNTFESSLNLFAKPYNDGHCFSGRNHFTGAGARGPDSAHPKQHRDRFLSRGIRRP
jgi:hypothetical protein